MKNIKDDLSFMRKAVTTDFLELIPLLQQHKKAQAEMRKADRRLNTFEIKYNFLKDIIKIGSHGDLLTAAIKKLLKSSGFEKVIHFKDKRQKTKREDLQAWSDKDIFIIEVKGLTTI